VEYSIFIHKCVAARGGVELQDWLKRKLISYARGASFRKGLKLQDMANKLDPMALKLIDTLEATVDTMSLLNLVVLCTESRVQQYHAFPVWAVPNYLLTFPNFLRLFLYKTLVEAILSYIYVRYGFEKPL
jgi:hypothetical protein